MNRWLARLSFTFFILAGLLVYQAYREMNLPPTVVVPKWRLALYFVAAGICAGLGMRGLRERHRSSDE